MTTGFAVRPLAGLLAALMLLVCACGGGSDGGGGGLSEKRAGELAKQYILDAFGVLTGDVNAQRLIDAFAPECREGVKASDIAAIAEFVSVFLPQLSEVEIEDVDLGKLRFEKTDEGIRVLPEDPNAIRVKIKGKFINANDFFSGLGMEESDSSIAEDAILIVERDGKAYLGECSDLGEFGATSNEEDDFALTVVSGVLSTPFPEATRPGGTAVPSATRPSATSVPVANRPGGTRATAVSLGSSVVVEATWRINVVSVNRDAAAVVEAASSFNDPPAADERMVLVKVRVENVSKEDEAKSFGDYEFELTGSRNQLYSGYSDKYSCGFIDDAISADLFPGGQATGDVCFKIPRDETGLLLAYDGFEEGPTYFKLD